MNVYSPWDIISLSIIIVILSPLYFWYTTQNTVHIVAFFGNIVTALSVELLKKYVFSENHRPSGAKGCNLLCSSENDEGKPGMPSGHSATMGFFAAYYGIKNPLYYIYTILMALSRNMKKCHTWPQIISGLLFGTGMGLVFKYH